MQKTKEVRRAMIVKVAHKVNTKRNKLCTITINMLVKPQCSNKKW